MKDKYWIAFSAIDSIESRFIQKLYNHFKDIEAAYNAKRSELEQIDGLSIKRAENFLRARDKINPDKAFSEVQRRGIRCINFDDENYPYMLKNIENPPMTLYIKGDLSRCNLSRTIAVVGSRKASQAGRDMLKKLLSKFSGTDICIVSGLAIGVDATAHEAVIENNLKTIGVIASGFDYTYPASSKRLYEKIENSFGAIISEYYPTFEPLKFRFPQRNRIVTGLSYGTLVAEAAIHSGALISANLCLEQGRELMCMPGLISNPNTEGIYKLLKQGATMVTCADDILNALNWEIKTADIKTQKLDMTELEQTVFNALEIEPKGFDAIAFETGLSVEDLLNCLTTLELKGIIKQSNDIYLRA